MRDLIRQIPGRASDGVGSVRSRSLLMTVMLACGKNATDPKDKVYGLYAILTRAGIPVNEPDYNKDLRTIYEEFFFSPMQFMHIVVVLTFMPLTLNVTNWPSWVPDLRHTLKSRVKELKKIRAHWGMQQTFHPSFQLRRRSGVLSLERVLLGRVGILHDAFPRKGTTERV
jgi:hypothetical protein